MCFRRPREIRNVGDRIADTFNKVYARGQYLRVGIKRIRRQIFREDVPRRSRPRFQ